MFGMWGGLTEDERRKILHQRKPRSRKTHPASQSPSERPCRPSVKKTHPPSESPSEVRGVFWHATKGRWVVVIRHRGRMPNALWPHHTGAEQLRPHRQRSTIALGDGGRCGGQNSSCSSANSVGSQGIVEERPNRRLATLDVAACGPHDSSALRKRMLLNKDHLPTCVSACVAW